MAKTPAERQKAYVAREKAKDPVAFAEKKKAENKKYKKNLRAKAEATNVALRGMEMMFKSASKEQTTLADSNLKTGNNARKRAGAVIAKFLRKMVPGRKRIGEPEKRVDESFDEWQAEGEERVDESFDRVPEDQYETVERRTEGYEYDEEHEADERRADERVDESLDRVPLYEAVEYEAVERYNTNTTWRKGTPVQLPLTLEHRLFVFNCDEDETLSTRANQMIQQASEHFVSVKPKDGLGGVLGQVKNDMPGHLMTKLWYIFNERVNVQHIKWDFKLDDAWRYECYMRDVVRELCPNYEIKHFNKGVERVKDWAHIEICSRDEEIRRKDEIISHQKVKIERLHDVLERLQPRHNYGDSQHSSKRRRGEY